ncbi:Uncharacterised protein [Segatella copri]|nr:Uncharacterised protein [Segatella copri]
MLSRIAINKEVYSFKSAQIGVRICQRKLKTIRKSANAAVYVFNNIMSQIHILRF